MPRPTGNRNGHWTEYEEQPLNCEPGYYWLRDDGLRMGFRERGRYYKQGAIPAPVPAAVQRGETYRTPYSFNAYGDGARAFPWNPEAKKMEYLEAHVRVTRDGECLETITMIDGYPVATLADGRAQVVFDHIDKKWPRRKK